MFNLSFLKDIGSIFSSGDVLGVDIGTASVKAVEVTRKKGLAYLNNYGILNNYGHFDRLNEVIQTSTMKIFDKEAVKLLQLLKKELKIKTKNVVASLPLFSAFSTLIEMPDISDQEVANTIQFKARQYVPMPLSEVTLDWMMVGKREKDGRVFRQILLVSVPTEKIKQYKEIFKSAGFNLAALEVESLSNVRALVGGDMTTTMIIDVGSHSTGILVAKGGFLKSSNQIDYAGSHLTHALSKGLNINLRRAEELKKQKGLTGTGGDYELSTIMFPFVDVIIKESIRVRNEYEKDQEDKVERVILTGGGANLPGLLEYVRSQTGVVTVKGSALSGFGFRDDMTPLVPELGTVLSVALGLSLREI
ncbi:MAG: type IV pilus assembly protein PilM [Candidatus Pacebacteria bacterium]|nr:type IV pilus assembly protein PilM [Candidatus Paceibacterota bacterium]